MRLIAKIFCPGARYGVHLLFHTLSLLLLLLSGTLSLAAADPDDEDSRRQRRLMVSQQLKAHGIEEQAVLGAMATVPRHLFVPRRLRSRAYMDGPLPIGYGQTISQPFIVAYMTEVLEIQPGDRVLEIGTGSGYQAAVLSRLGTQVHSVEIIPQLAKNAAKRLSDLGYRNVRVKQGDGYHGWPGQAPFDAIMVTAAAEFIPPPLVRQLKEGGKMIIPVGSPFHVQQLMLVTKKKGKVTTRSLLPVRFVPFRREK